MTGRLLVTYEGESNHTANTAEYLANIGKHSTWDVRYAHVTRGAEMAFDLGDFDAVFQTYSARLQVDRLVSPDYLARLRSFKGVKLLAVQDEIDRTGKLREAIRQLGYHVVLSCVRASELPKIYPREMFPETEFIPVLPASVPDHLAARGREVRPLRERPIHIGYRGGYLSARYGRLGFLKFEIGRRMREICEERGIPHDIEWSADNRIYGSAWYDFLASCRTTLGSECCSNIYDFDGAVEEAHSRLVAERGRPLFYDEFRAYTDPLDAQYDSALIPPRVFEAAALRTPLVLFSGRYSGLIEPEKHYIELKQDFSNVDAVLARLNDLDGLERLADRAYERLVGSGEFSYRRFVGFIDETLSRKARELGVTLRPARADRGEAELWADPMELASLRVEPTQVPQHFVFHAYRRAARRLAELEAVYPAETARLGAEIARLNEVYPAEVARLNAALAETWLWRAIKRKAKAAGILAGHRLGRTALAQALWRRRVDRGLLAQLAQVLAIGPLWMGKRVVLVPLLSGNELTLYATLADKPAQLAGQPASGSDLVAALSARRIERCLLVGDPAIAACGLVTADSGSELPDLLSWLTERPERALRLPIATRVRGGEKPSPEMPRHAAPEQP